MRLAGRFLGVLLALAWTAAGLAQPPADTTIPAGALEVRINYISSTAAYVDKGSADGLEVGARLHVMRRGELVAVLEVDYVASRSASCRIVSELRTVERGDVAYVVTVGEAVEPAAPPVPSEPIEVGEPVVETWRQPSPAGKAERRPTVISGSLTVGVDQFDDRSDLEQGSSETTGRLNLRARNIEGSAWDFNARLRGRRIDRDRPAGSSGLRTENRDRLYELSLTWDPEGGKSFVQLGRLGSTPFVSLGYLDGALAQYRFASRFHLGAFAGSEPAIDDFSSLGEKYGAYVRYSTPPTTSLFADVVVGGVSQVRSGEVSRDYVLVETQLRSGSRWFLYQRSEIDLNRDWRAEVSEQDYQLSSLSLASSYRFSDRLRLSLSYDRRRRYRDADSRDTPEEQFDDLLREGLRASATFGRPRSWTATTTFGLRGRESFDDATRSFAGSLRFPRVAGSRFSTGLSVSAYTGDVADGQLVSLNLRRDFAGDHEVGVTIGTSRTTVQRTGADRSNDWVRLNGMIALPHRFFLFGEVERMSGDDREGTRIHVDLGYRF